MTKQEALEQSIILWRRMAMTGSEDKGREIRVLYLRGKLPVSSYIHSCPLCQFGNDSRPIDPSSAQALDYCCDYCPWPGMSYARCEDFGSPYRVWMEAYGKLGRQHAASRVLQFLKKLLKRNS